MSALNIVTVAHGEDWLSHHLRRFIWQAKLTNPDADYYLMIPYDKAERSEAWRWKRKLAPHFTDIVLTPVFPVPGRLVYYEILRSNSLEAFNLSECLYLDADADIIANLDHLRDMNPDANLLWVPNAVHKNEVEEALKVNGLCTDPPYSDPGFLYMRRSYADEFERARRDYKHPEDKYVPSVSMWNMAMRRAGDTAKIPYSYNTAYFMQDSLKDAKVVHFVGDKGKELRKQYDLSTLPDNLTIRLRDFVEPGLEWS